MTPEQLLAALGPDTIARARPTESFGVLTVDVEAAHWRTAAAALRDEPACAMDFFDWLSAYDEPPTGLSVVARVWSTGLRHAVVLRTRVARDGATLPSLTALWAGAAWHERETHEMFGIGFEDHPGLHPLLLPDGFDGHPLRKDFALASRDAKQWPGAKEPGESDADLAAAPTVRGRPRKRPPGLPGADSRRIEP
jgi:NADH-quinone oxidoreductase subunit C